MYVFLWNYWGIETAVKISSLYSNTWRFTVRNMTGVHETVSYI